MLSLLVAYFGKGRIPNSIRYSLMTIGLTLLAYRLYKIYKANKAYNEAMAIQHVIDQKNVQTARVVEKYPHLQRPPPQRPQPQQPAAS